MRISQCFLLLIILFTFSCKLKPESFAANYLNANNISAQIFYINIQKDTIVTTQAGISIKIDANSIEASTQTITLEIKEALDLFDILKAGLTTETKDEILSSDGMFKITTKEKSIIKKPLQLKIPTSTYNYNMQLYKGIEKDGKIIWENPAPIVKALQKPNGKSLFVKNCASCHSVGKPLTGPDLAYVEERWQKRKNLVAFIKNCNKFLKGKNMSMVSDSSEIEYDYIKTNTSENFKIEVEAKNIESVNSKQNLKRDTLSLNFADEEKKQKQYKKDHEEERDLLYARFMYCQNKQTAMTVFDGVLKDEEVSAILEYINAESKLCSKPINQFAYDTCLKYAKKYELLQLKKQELQNERNAATKKLSVTVNQKGLNNNVNTNSSININPVINNKYKYTQAEVYEVSIETYGWYNIDVIMNSNNAVDCELKVTVDESLSKKYNVYIIIPQTKTFTQGSLLDNATNQYGFYSKDGKTSLPLGLQAYIFAIGEEKEKIFYALEPFNIKAKQDIGIKIESTTKDNLLEKIKNIGLKDFKMGIEKTKNYDEIKSVEEQLKQLEEKVKTGCDCLNKLPENIFYSNKQFSIK